MPLYRLTYLHLWSPAGGMCGEIREPLGGEASGGSRTLGQTWKVYDLTLPCVNLSASSVWVNMSPASFPIWNVCYQIRPGDLWSHIYAYKHWKKIHKNTFYIDWVLFCGDSKYVHNSGWIEGRRGLTNNFLYPDYYHLQLQTLIYLFTKAIKRSRPYLKNLQTWAK